MNLWESLSGGLLLELTGADLPRSLKAVADAGISLFQLEPAGDLSCTFRIRRRDCKKLQTLCQKRGDSLKVLRRLGLYWAGKGLLRRPVLLCGMIFLMSAGLYLPSRVLFIRVEGNHTIPARQILEAGESCGVSFGASRRYVRSEKVKNALLGAIPELSWAGVNTSGCTAVISVRERTPSPEPPEDFPAQIVADRDGYILSADVTRGTALCRPGQTVRKGQTLVSGYADCGICIRATGAKGEIFAQTRREFQAVTPVQWMKKRPTGEVKRKISLRIQKKRINLWKDSGICDATCGRMYSEYQITLPGGFRLPAAVCVETYTVCTLEPSQLDGLAAEAALKSFAERCLSQQMVSGKVLGRDQLVVRDGDVYRLEGVYDCMEMIGRAEKIGEINGKRD